MANHFTPSNSLIFHKIHFSMRKRVRFGQGLFVCGNIPELGLWEPSKAYRLKWNEGDNWSGSILLNAHTPETIQYKYIIADWNKPSTASIEWEIGNHNRMLDLDPPKTTIICDDKWNMDKITLTLHVSKNKAHTEEKYYVIGDLQQLGNWQEKKQMKKVNKKYMTWGRRQNLSAPLNPEAQQESYTYSFYTYRGKEQFYYYYIKKGTVIQSERRPGRVFIFQNQNSTHPYRRDVAHFRGEINIIDDCNINELIFSQITPQILVGSYPRSVMDIHKLKENKVSAIFSIQSERDFKSHGLTPYFLSLICQEQGIKYKRCSILDMNNDDFINKAEGGVKMMRDLIKDGEKVYVHCSAGIYRSPQMIALYLTLFEKYSIEQAVNTIKASHPYAKPNCKVIRDAIGLMQLHRTNRMVLI